MSLRLRLIVLVILAVLPAIAILAYNQFELRAVRTAQIHEEALRLAQLASAEVDRIGNGARQMLLAVTASPAVRAGDWAACNVMLERLVARTTGYINIGIVSPAGDIVCSGLPKARGMNIGRSHSFQMVSRAEEFVVGTYEASDISGAKILHYAEPFRGEHGERLGTIWATLDLDWLALHFSDRFSTSDVTLTIADRDGTILVRLPDPQGYVGRPFSPQYRPLLSATADGTAEMAGFDGVVRIIGYTPLATRPKGIYVGVGLAKSALLADANRATVTGAVLSAICGALAVLAAWLGGAAFIRKPITTLLGASARWRAGDYAARVRFRNSRSEIAQLGAAFDDMAAELQRRDADQKHTEHELRNFNDTLERRIAERTAALVSANERLAAEMKERQHAEAALRHAQKMEAVGQLTGGIAHDFNNLLMVIGGNLGLLMERLTDETDQRLVRAAQRGANRGAKLVESLLAFSRREALRPETVNPNRLIKEFSDLLRRAAGDTVQVQFVLNPTVDPCRVDPSQFQSALLNLVANARDAMPPSGGRISIETENAVLDGDGAPGVAAGTYVRIAVSDTGRGMAPDVLEHACEPFFTTKEVGKGTGLGLSQVYGFAKQSDGQIQISSEVGVGTTILLFLPSAHGDAIAAKEPAVMSAPPRPAGRKTILVVEDDTDVRETVAENLAALGYHVLTAEDGLVALAIIETSQHVDLMLTDISMPNGLRGDELARRARHLRRGLKVILTSGHVATPTASDLDCTMLVKPYDPEALGRAVAAALGF